MDYEKADDRALIAAIAKGDAAALEALYARHGLWLLNLLLVWLHDRQWAEEKLQDVMLAVWQGAAQFRGDSQIKTWLFGIAHRQALKALRDQHPQDVLLSLEEDATELSQPYPVDVQQMAVNEALAGLPLDQQIALELVCYRGMTIQEAAAQLEIPPNTLKSRLFRARASLRHLLLTEFEESDHA